MVVDFAAVPAAAVCTVAMAAAPQELVVYPNEISHSVQAVFFVLSPGER